VISSFATVLLLCRGVKRRFGLAMLALSFFEGVATVLVTFLPTGGKPGRRNWRLHSLRDRRFIQFT
jgi:hypothetical protein